MKNYPNQASDFARVRGTLDIVRELNDAGQNPHDDGVLGTAAVLRGVYEFRNMPFEQTSADALGARLEEERAKPSGNQGMRTFARELRRTLHDMGWIDHADRLTAEGEALLATEPGSAEERAMLADGLLHIEVPDETGTSHPVRVMLNLLAIAPSFHRQGLELALEAHDDSQAELGRLTTLYQMAPEERQTALGINDTKRANAVKVFPTLAKTAGLVDQDSNGNFVLAADGNLVLGIPAGEVPQPIRARARVTTSIGTRVTAQTIAARVPTSTPRFLTQAEQRRATARLSERTVKHQQLVKDFFSYTLDGDSEGELLEHIYSYDALWLPTAAASCYLFEMKTVNNDADHQARAALGQLAYYDYFKVAPRWPDRTVIRCAVFDLDIGPELGAFLEDEGVAAIAFVDGQAIALNPRGQAVIDGLPHALGA